MLLIQKPVDEHNYCKVENELSKWLQKQGYKPRYFDGMYYYYKRDEVCKIILNDSERGE